MGFWRSVALLATGAVAGYIATRQKLVERGSKLALKHNGHLERLNRGETAVAKFFDSSLGKPLQPIAIKVVQFVIRVKSGMSEKEAELHQRFEQQKKDIRPGSIDSWDSEQTFSNRSSQNSDPGLSEVPANEPTEQLKRRVQRDQELGSDFFS